MKANDRLSKPSTFIIYGAGGHGKVVLDAALSMGLSVTLLLDDYPRVQHIAGVRVFSSSEFDISALDDFAFIIGIGANSDRRQKFNILKEQGEALSVCHPFTCISRYAKIGHGVAILPGAIVNIGASIQDNVIVNTGASVDHDCIVASHTHLCPGVRLAGNVTVGEGTMIGTGSAVIPGISIGANCIIGAGSIVVHDIPDNSVALGAPARVIRTNAASDPGQFG